MDLEVGAILEGKVTGITKFGAFVTFPSGKSGLVHISEIAYPYVQNVSDHLAQGQTVKVKVIGIDENGRINLSIKKANEQPRPELRASQSPVRSQHAVKAAPVLAPAAQTEATAPSQEVSFEDKLRRFLQDSDSKMAGTKLYSDRRSGSRRRGK
ncbi:MAG TPA: S1 RNA-binding domain-containing protein [Clostridiales bacterium]|jgi:S1 RNA binding domain protein|nr:S1 RNA-binding domain-containing protein [Clostridiales bacterium]